MNQWIHKNIHEGIEIETMVDRNTSRSWEIPLQWLWSCYIYSFTYAKQFILQDMLINEKCTVSSKFNHWIHNTNHEGIGFPRKVFIENLPVIVKHHFNEFEVATIMFYLFKTFISYRMG